MINWLSIALPALMSIGAAAGLVPLAIRMSHRYELLDLPGQHKRHKRPVPILGGAALFVTYWVVIPISALLFPSAIGAQMAVLPYIFAGSLIIMLVGLSDDLSPLSAGTKILAEVAAGLVLYMGGLRIDPITIPFAGAVATGTAAPLITVAWVVGLSNAINLIDGLDGLAAGVSLIAALSMTAVGFAYGDAAIMLVCAVVSGFLFVFLYFNRYPAKIFLGDSGALQLGFYFAVISLLVPIRTYAASALYLPLLALGVPILETGISFSRRLLAGRNVMKADRRHLFHYLSLAGLSPRRTVLVFYSVSIAFGLFTVAALYLNRYWVFGFLGLFMVVIFVLFYIFMSNLSRSWRRYSGGRNSVDSRKQNGESHG